MKKYHAPFGFTRGNSQIHPVLLEKLVFYPQFGYNNVTNIYKIYIIDLNTIKLNYCSYIQNI